MSPEDRIQNESVSEEKPSNEAADTEAEPKIKLEYIQSQREPTYYVNNAQFAISPFDLRIDLGELQSADQQTKTLYSVHKARLMFSWHFAKTFLIVLKAQIDQYEKTFGTIPVVPSAAERLK